LVLRTKTLSSNRLSRFSGGPKRFLLSSSSSSEEETPKENHHHHAKRRRLDAFNAIVVVVVVPFPSFFMGKTQPKSSEEGRIGVDCRRSFSSSSEREETRGRRFGEGGRGRPTKRGRAGGETQPRATARRGGDRLRDGFFRGAEIGRQRETLGRDERVVEGDEREREFAKLGKKRVEEQSRRRSRVVVVWRRRKKRRRWGVSIDCEFETASIFERRV